MRSPVLRGRGQKKDPAHKTKEALLLRQQASQAGTVSQKPRNGVTNWCAAERPWR